MINRTVSNTALDQGMESFQILKAFLCFTRTKWGNMISPVMGVHIVKILSALANRAEIWGLAQVYPPKIP